MTTATRDDLDELKRRLTIEAYFRQHGSTQDVQGRWRCPCSARHTNGDAHHSVTISNGHARCWSQHCFGENGADILQVVGVLEHLADFKSQKRRVQELAGVPIDGARQAVRQILRRFPYRDGHGHKAYKLRWNTDTQGSKYTWARDPEGHARGKGDCEPTLYLLERVVTVPRAIVVEGERDSDTVNAWLIELGILDIIATTTPNGAGDVKSAFLQPLHGKVQVFLTGDNDEAGLDYVRKCGTLLLAHVPDLRCVIVPDQVKDWTEWKERSATAEEFRQLLNAAPPWRPETQAALHHGHDDDDDHDDKTHNKSQATQLVGLASKDVKFFHSPEGEAFADIQCGNHREIYTIKSKAFRLWLAGRFFQSTKNAIGGQSMQDALSVLSSKALFQGEEREVSLRVAECGGNIYLDLGNADWQSICVTPRGWSLTNSPPVSFRRPKSMMALPIPTPGGSVDLLREVLNISDDSQWTLFVGFILAALRPRGPYPVLVLDGEQGTGKTFIAYTVKSLIDPTRAGNRGEPRDVRDLMIAATNGWMLSFDNLSRISPELSDGLCRLSTGGGLATRELFSDAEETIFDARRPVVINAIGDVVTRADLVDRAVIVTPTVITAQQRREEHFLETRLNDIRPLVLGALLDAISHGLRTVESVHLPGLPRMADFAVWVTACAPALGWGPKRFIDAYFTNRSDAVEIGLEASPLVGPLRALLVNGPWEGTASELLTRLTEIGGEAARKMKDWPTKPNVLSNSLKRLAPALRETGLIVTRKERTATGRGLHLEQRANSSSSSSPSSQNDGHDGHDDEIPSSSCCLLNQEEVIDVD